MISTIERKVDRLVGLEMARREQAEIVGGKNESQQPAGLDDFICYLGYFCFSGQMRLPDLDTLVWKNLKLEPWQT